jgi:phosphoribosylanthranilate isomerase
MVDTAQNVNRIVLRCVALVGTSSAFGKTSLIVQIYEIQTPTEAEIILELGVDHIGSVVLSETEWKNPEIYDTVRLAQSAGCRSSLIPLFNTFDQPESVRQVLRYYQPDIIHFCDSLSDGMGIRDVCRKMIDLQKIVKKEFPEIAIMRSIPIAQSEFAHQVPTFELAVLFETVSDYFLTDTLIVESAAPLAPSTTEQPVSGFIGITGRTCNWEVARQLVENTRIPVILAGGISPENVEESLTLVRPAGVDSCTGTNAIDDCGQSIRFKKDPEKVKRLVEAVRKPQR